MKIYEKKSSKKIVYIVLLVFLIFGVYYIYNHIHQKNAAELINELTMLNQKKEFARKSYETELHAFVVSLRSDKFSEDQLSGDMEEINNLKNSYLSRLKEIRNELKISRVQEYMDNYIKREMLGVEMMFLPFKIFDNRYNGINIGKQESSNEINNYDDYLEQLKPLNEAKYEMEKDFSKIIKQPVILD